MTLVWQYIFDGPFDHVIFEFLDSTAIIVDKHILDSDADVPENAYQGRIQENINITRAEITIFVLQRWESGVYQIELLDGNRKRARNKMNVQVQCK